MKKEESSQRSTVALSSFNNPNFNPIMPLRRTGPAPIVSLSRPLGHPSLMQSLQTTSHPRQKKNGPESGGKVRLLSQISNNYIDHHHCIEDARSESHYYQEILDAIDTVLLICESDNHEETGVQHAQ